MKLFPTCLIILLMITVSETGLMAQRNANNEPFSLPNEEFTVDNEFEVGLQEDLSDAIVGVAAVAHVGSNRGKR